MTQDTFVEMLAREFVLYFGAIQIALAAGLIVFLAGAVTHVVATWRRERKALIKSHRHYEDRRHNMRPEEIIIGRTYLFPGDVRDVRLTPKRFLTKHGVPLVKCYCDLYDGDIIGTVSEFCYAVKGPAPVST